MPHEWEWVASTNAVLSGTLILLWLLASIWRFIRKMSFFAVAVRKGLNMTYFEEDQLVLLSEFAHRGDQLNPDLVTLGSSFLSHLEVKHALSQMESSGYVTKDHSGGYSLTTTGKERALLMLKLVRERKAAVLRKPSSF